MGTEVGQDDDGVLVYDTEGGGGSVHLQTVPQDETPFECFDQDQSEEVIRHANGILGFVRSRMA
jgi:hypothetical protein